jgi:1,4-alpha-glucan branching enzyme
MKVLKFFGLLLIASVVIVSSCNDEDKATEQSFTFVVTVPAETPEGADVYIAGDMNEWEPSEAFKLAKGSDGKYSITVVGLDEGAEYKYVLNGTMDNVELAAAVEDADCADEIANRKTGSSATINDTVANWKGVTTCIEPEEEEEED